MKKITEIQKGLEKRQIYFLKLNKLSEWRQKYKKKLGDFSVFFINDQDALLDEEKVSRFASELIEDGVVLFHCYGKRCDKIESIFDLETVRRSISSCDETALSIVTISHSNDEILDEALQFFIYNSEPAEHFIANCKNWLIIYCGKNPPQEQLLKVEKGTIHFK